MPGCDHPALRFRDFHDEDAEIYINGIQAAQASGFITEYETLPVQTAARALLKPGDRIPLAAHCHQTTGGQGIDVGLCEEKD